MGESALDGCGSRKHIPAHLGENGGEERERIRKRGERSAAVYKQGL